jgi:hypothetical protein
MMARPVAYRWSILGTAADVHRSSERAAVLKALETAGADGLSVAEIMGATGSQNRNATDILLFKMTETGEVSRVKPGVYARNLSDLSEPSSLKILLFRPSGLQTKRLRADNAPEACNALNMLLGVTLSADAMGKVIDYDAITARLKAKRHRR